MMIPVKDFFENLTPKSCSTCGEQIEELADCYQNKCDPCEDTQYYSFTPSYENE